MPRKKTAVTPSSRVIRTKFGPPRAARKQVRRDRALSLLALGAERTLCLLRAPAGFGKTTVLADWRAHCISTQRPVAWVTLDEDDNDPNSFVTYLIRALSEALGSLADHLTEFSTESGGASPKVALTSVINALDSIDVPVTLILDDYDRIQASSIHDLMSFLLLHAPENLHIIVAARAEPPLPLAYLRAHDELVEIDATQLRFSYEDARRFFGEVAAIELDSGVLRAVFDATEGWVAGMQMAALSLREPGDARRAIEGLSGSARAINDYLAATVLPSLDAQTVDVLMRLSILERFNGALCEAVGACTEGRSLLQRLLQQNHFLQSLDDEQTWFRYHALFRDFLRGELLQRLPAELSGLHERAARWFADQQLWAEAVRHALAAERTDLAVEWVEHCAMREVEDSRVHTLLAWVRKLPAAAIRSRHRLRLAVAWALLLTIQLDEALAIVDDLSVLTASGATANTAAFDMELLALRFCITALRDDTAQALPLGERFVDTLRGGLRLDESAMWAVQATLNGLTHCYQKAGRVDDARAMQQLDIYPLTQDSARNLFTQCYRATTLGACDIREARLFEGARQMREAMTLAERHAGRRSAAATLVACSLAAVHYEWNELDTVDQLLADRLDVVDEACYLDSVRSAYLALTRLASTRGDLDTAHALLDRGELVANRRGWQRLTAVCLAERVRLYLMDQHPLEADAACARLERMSLATPPGTPSAQSETWRVRGLARARCLLHAQRADEAATLLQAALADENPVTSPYPCMRTRLLLAVALAQSQQLDAARAQIRALLQIGAASGALRSIVDEGAPIAALIRQQLALIDAPGVASSTWSARLSQTLAPTQEQDAARASTKPSARLGLIEPLSKREHDVLTLVAKGLSNEQAARALHLGAETVKWHLKNVYAKLGVTRRTLAVHRARQMDLISDEPPSA